MTTLGLVLVKTRREDCPPRSSTNSSKTILTTCSDGFSSCQTCWPSAFSLTEAIKSLATLKLTSASSNASRISRSAASTCSFVSTPSPRRFFNVRFSLSERDSNILHQAQFRAFTETQMIAVCLKECQGSLNRHSQRFGKQIEYFPR